MLKRKISRFFPIPPAQTLQRVGCSLPLASFSSCQAQRTWLLHTQKFLFPNQFTESAPQRRRFTHITDVKGILAGSDKIWMIGRQGVPVPVFRTSSLVQSLWGQKSLNADDTGSNVKINFFMHYGTAKVKISYTLE